MTLNIGLIRFLDATLHYLKGSHLTFHFPNQIGWDVLVTVPCVISCCALFLVSRIEHISFAFMGENDALF